MIVVVDSSSLITLSGSCLIRILKHISKSRGITFIIPESVYNESVKRPLKIMHYELNAIRIRDAVEEGYLQVARTTPGIKKSMEEFSRVSAQLCTTRGRKITLINEGEAETLALLKELDSSVLMIDERTTRMLIEEPENVVSFLEYRNKCRVKLNKANLETFRKFLSKIKVIRSVEAIALAYEDGSFANELHKSKQALEAALFAAKFGGCAVNISEIRDFLRNEKT